MLARSSVLRHPSGVTLRTPLLVPSFSSRGLGFNRKGISEIKDIFLITADIITESMLVSAYDIKYNHLPNPAKISLTPSITIVDSGGYETGINYDFSAVYQYDYRHRKWDRRIYERVLDSWPKRIAAIFVNFDKESAGRSVIRQIANACELLSRYPEQLHAFLLKPTRSSRGSLRTTINSARGHLDKLADFHVIGVTEKELGRNMLDRMETIAELRKGLDDAGVTAPIQVFGALDPLSSVLYCISGAEIFDGLTWLRFSYKDGQCIYPRNYGAQYIGLDADDDFLRAKELYDNYSYLCDLQLCLRGYAKSGDLTKLNRRIVPDLDFLKRALGALIFRLGGTT